MYTYTFDRPRGGVRNFYLGGQVETLIYLSKQPHIHIHIRFFIIYTLFYLISYIYTHTKQQQKELNNFN
mgnify:CR=1 FL=1